MKIVQTIARLVHRATTGKLSRMSNTELLQNLHTARSQAKVALNRCHDIDDREDANPWSRHQSTASKEAMWIWQRAEARVRRLEKEVGKRGLHPHGTSSGPDDTYHRSSAGPQRPTPARAPEPPRPAGMSSKLAALLDDANVDRRAFHVAQLSSDYINSPSLRHEIRAVLAGTSRRDTTRNYQKAALKLHPDKVLPHADVASAREAQQLSDNLNALWQAFGSVYNELNEGLPR